jgi:hypothetical protein
VVCSGEPVTSCSPSGSGNGIFPSANSVISISDGIIQGMGGYGINLKGSRNRITNVEADSNAGGGIFAGAPSMVSSCTANSNGGNGIGAFRTVSGSTATGNQGFGIFAGGAIIGNFASFNGFGGISSNGTAIDNQASENGGSGVEGFRTFIGNSSFGNSGAGIAASCPSLIAMNSAGGNTGVSIFPIGSGCTKVNNSAP